MIDDRRARLASLAARAGRNETNKKQMEEDTTNTTFDNDTHDANDCGAINKNENTKKAIKFRNYTPKDEKLGNDDVNNDDVKRLKKRSKLDNYDDPTTSTPTIPETSELEKALIEAKADAALLLQEKEDGAPTAPAEVSPIPSITSIAPKKVNWDLKRDIAKKLNKLERRTQKAIVDLLRERLEKEAEEGSHGGDDDNDNNDLD